MTPKEKAKELFDIMYQVSDEYNKYPMCFDTAKQCAIVAVDEISEHCYQVMKPFWEEVKQEIEKL